MRSDKATFDGGIDGVWALASLLNSPGGGDTGTIGEVAKGLEERRDVKRFL